MLATSMFHSKVAGLAGDIQVGIVVRNLTDVSYRDYLRRYKEFALDEGRNVLVRVSTGL